MFCVKEMGYFWQELSDINILQRIPCKLCIIFPISLIMLSSNTPTLLENSQEENGHDLPCPENLRIELGQGFTNTLLPS